MLEAFIGPEPNGGLPIVEGGGDWKGLPVEDGTLRRRPVGREPGIYILCARPCEGGGETTGWLQRGLPWPFEKVAEGGLA